MIRPTLMLALALTAAPCALAADTTLTPDGQGPVRIGMTGDEALAALGAGWTYNEQHDGDDGPGGRSCGYIEGADNAAMAYMVEDGFVLRVEALTPAILTEKGIHIGSTEADVRAAYGDKLQVSPHKYEDAPALYMDIWFVDGPPSPDQAAMKDTARGIRFETSVHGKVMHMFGGGPSIHLIEGCS